MPTAVPCATQEEFFTEEIVIAVYYFFILCIDTQCLKLEPRQFQLVLL